MAIYKANANGITHKDLIIGSQKHKAVYAGDKLIWQKVLAKRNHLFYYPLSIYGLPNGVMIASLFASVCAIGPFSENTLTFDEQITYVFEWDTYDHDIIMKFNNEFYGVVYQYYKPRESIKIIKFFKLSNKGEMISEMDRPYIFKNTKYKRSKIEGYCIVGGYFYFTIRYCQDVFHSADDTCITYIFDAEGNLIETTACDLDNEGYPINNNVYESLETGTIAGIPYSFGSSTYRLSFPSLTRVNDIYEYAAYYNGEYLFAKTREKNGIVYEQIQLYSYDGNNFKLRADFSSAPQIKRMDYFASTSCKPISVCDPIIYLAFKENKKIKVICADGITNLPSGKVVYEAEDMSGMEFKAIYACERKLYVFYIQEHDHTVIDIVDMK